LNLRITLIILIVGSWVAIGAAFILDADFGDEQKVEEPPYFYNIPVEDITSIRLEYDGASVSFKLRENINRWYFENDETYYEVPADLYRFGGITALLGGPRSQRVLQNEIQDPVQYGLDNPTSRYTIGMRDGSERVLLLGKSTVSGDADYAQIEGYQQLVLVDASWSGVLNRLVTDPPVPEWMFVLNPSEVREILLFDNNEVIRAYGIDRTTREYHLCDLPIVEDPCAGTVGVDAEAFTAALNLIAERRIDGAVALNLLDETDFEKYGATTTSPYIAIRIERPSPTQVNVTEVDRVSMTIGDVAPDGIHRYAVANETSDVVYIEREWGDKLLELFTGPALTTVN
jgi:hypothetical protein